MRAWELLVEDKNIVVKLDGVDVPGPYNDIDHARNKASKLVSYGKGKVGEIYVDGKIKMRLELNKKHQYFDEAAPPKVGRDFQHAEDLVIVDGSKGALRALDQLESMASSVEDVTIKWDGSPAVYFGRDQDGAFVLTDKSGFTAKGYDGKVKNKEALSQMLLSRGKEAPDDSRKAFAGAMASIWDLFEKSVDPGFRGFVFGDMLYFKQPQRNQDNEFEFTPNTVTYDIPAESDLGIRIAKSQAGIVVHHFQNLDGEKTPIKGPLKGINSGDVLIVGPTTVTKTPDVNNEEIESVRKYVTQNSGAIDTLLDDAKLASMKMTDFKNTLYKFVNQQVKTRDLTNLDSKFDQWLESSGISGPKKTKIQEFRKNQSRAFVAVFSTLEQIMNIKDSIIDQLDASSPVKASINKQPGGEGYVKGDIKLVPRTKFTAANIEKHA